MIRQLHITNWYPNPFNHHEAPFIREWFQAIPAQVDKQLWHVEVRSEAAFFRIHKGSYSDQEHYLILNTRFRSWRVKELLHLVLLIYLRLTLGPKWWGVVTVHIAYPLLRFTRAFKFLFGRRIVISEHWSAYHNGFNLKPGSRAWRRIQRIFQHQIPVITVSEALAKDIIDFSESARFRRHVIPNIVDPEIFFPPGSPSQHEQTVFLMVGNWAPIKRPLLILTAFTELLKTEPLAELRIAGHGAQMEAMRKFAVEHQVGENIKFLGPLPKAEIANEMRMASALVHASDYETFSVVCAEAVCCGTPVIASAVGGITEFIDETKGVLVRNEQANWSSALYEFARSESPYDGQAISNLARSRFSPETVGRQIQKVLSNYAGQG